PWRSVGQHSPARLLEGKRQPEFRLSPGVAPAQWVPTPAGAQLARSRVAREDSIPGAPTVCLSPPASPTRERAGAIVAMSEAVISSSERSSPPHRDPPTAPRI